MRSSKLFDETLRTQYEYFLSAVIKPDILYITFLLHVLPTLARSVK